MSYTRRNFIKTTAAASASTVIANPLLAGEIFGPAMRTGDAPYTSNEYKNNYRRLVFDMHIPDWGDHLLAKFDPAKTAESIKKANINQVMAYAQSHQGLCYWPTKVGNAHAGMKGRDFFGEFSGELKKRDITVTAYYCVVFNSGAIRDHHDWRMVEKPGKPYEEQYSVNRYGLSCPNNAEYHKQTMNEVEELLANYEFDVMFFDMAFWRTPCFCESCQARYKKETGNTIPGNIDWNNPGWVEYQTVRERWTGEFMKDLSDLTHQVHPDLPVYHNMAGSTFDWNMSNNFEHTKYSTFLGGDFYGDAADQLLEVKLFNNLTENRPIEYMTSRAYPSVKEHVNNKSTGELEMVSLAAISQHAAFTLIDSVNADGTFDQGVYELLEKMNANIAPYEPELGGEPVEDIAIYFSNDSKMKFIDKSDVTKKEDSLFGTGSSKDYPHMNAIHGTVEKLQARHIPFGVITRKQLHALEKYKMLILPDVLRMDKEEVKAIKRYVKNGGRVYASRWTSLTETSGKRHDDFMLADLFGCHFESSETGQVNFLKPASSEIESKLLGQKYLSHDNNKSAGTGTLYLSEKCEGDVLATLTKAYFQVPGTVVDGKFESLHTTPPARDTKKPILVHNRYGKGEIIYSSANIETGTSAAHESLFDAIINMLKIGEWSFESDTFPAVWSTLFDQPERDRYVFSLLNYQMQLPAIPIDNVPFVLRPPEGKQFKNLVSLPDKKDIPFTLESDGTLKAEIPSLEKMVMLAAEYKNYQS
ncbi:MAG: alpha-amylase family protein [Bacteroidota bacterium]